MLLLSDLFHSLGLGFKLLLDLESFCSNQFDVFLAMHYQFLQFLIGLDNFCSFLSGFLVESIYLDINLCHMLSQVLLHCILPSLVLLRFKLKVISQSYQFGKVLLVAFFKLLETLLVGLETEMLCCFLELLEHLLLKVAELLCHYLLVFFYRFLLFVGLL